MEEFKRKLIGQYLQSKLMLTPERLEFLIERVSRVCRIQTTIKYQELEEEGAADLGRVWFSIDGMVHSYYYNKATGSIHGTQIWKKMELILFPASLIRGDYRTNHIQMLEPGKVLSVSYPDALALRNEFSEIAEIVEQVAILNEKAYKHRVMLFNEPSLVRIIRFEEENPLFSKIANETIKATHLGLSRQTYSRLKKKVSTRKG